MTHPLKLQEILLIGNGHQPMLEVFYRRVRYITKNVFSVEGAVYSYDVYPYDIILECYRKRILLSTQHIHISPMTFIDFTINLPNAFRLKDIKFVARIQQKV